MDANTRAASIRLIAFDIDGVMTDGGLHYDDHGGELKTFNVQDGLGIKLLQRLGFHVAIVTGRTSGVVACRAADLGIEHVHQGVSNKKATVDSLRQQLSLEWSECAFMGDDLIDLAVMAQSGLAIAPANARPIVQRHAHVTTRAAGGHGAVREAIELILAAQDKLDIAFAPYLP
ncbi:HAD hydrolase family protein [Dechloromonas sp. TW-R-39-2]|jgi:3-deoxy-D-manno-octulosonate 8-phosphate phosphatase (KDO 8-P phosphatase)|uniref:KdsC family phosphatase n=1 Tax=Dechloromonas sp. TW-R-39-2 TaxID=2654218 RepID=UPI00193E2558|nr:HAD hydrolase family protein [Dechloromonas sp. TW-R-39-2]QRM20618.1 HAD hydrolase family protein [Dechloromonas sp. TW-R-39-2]